MDTKASNGDDGESKGEGSTGTTSAQGSSSAIDPAVLAADPAVLAADIAFLQKDGYQATASGIELSKWLDTLENFSDLLGPQADRLICIILKEEKRHQEFTKLLKPIEQFEAKYGCEYDKAWADQDAYEIHLSAARNIHILIQECDDAIDYAQGCISGIWQHIVINLELRNHYRFSEMVILEMTATKIQTHQKFLKSESICE